MREFNYHQPATVREALELLKTYSNKAKVIAGGTDLLVELRKEVGPGEPENVINIAHFTELKYIQVEADRIRIGSGTTHTMLVESAELLREISALPEAARTVGSPQIRNRGTVGGNILNASPAADTVPVLVALDALLTLQSLDDNGEIVERQVPIAEIYVKPYKTHVRPEELLTEVSFQRLPNTARSAFIKLGRRNALAISRMNVAVIVNSDETGTLTDVRIAAGSTTPKPGRSYTAEAVLLGQKPTDELITLAGKKVSEEMINLTGYRWSTEYKEPVIEALVRRGIRKALEVRP